MVVKLAYRRTLLNTIDLIGKRFGRLVALEFQGIHHRNARWKCQCDCGTVTIVSRCSLVQNNTQSCGCLRRERIAQGTTKVHPGQVYGRLSVVKRRKDLETTKRTLHECLCDCGNTIVVLTSNMRSGKTKSCGCYNAEVLSKRRTTHGLSGTKSFRDFHNHKQRELRNKFDVEWTLEMEVKLKEIQSECVLCGSKENLAVDHMLPVSKGYGLRPGNAVILCKSCNSRKSNKVLQELPIEIQSKLVAAAEEFRIKWEGVY